LVCKDGVYMTVDHESARAETKDGCRTLVELLEKQVGRRGTAPFLGTIDRERNEVVYESYAEVWQKIDQVAVFLESKTRRGEMVGVCSINRKEWTIMEYATYKAGCINCPLYTTFPAPALLDIMRETEMGVLAASAQKARFLLDTVLKSEAMGVRIVLLMDSDDAVRQGLEERGIEVHMMADLWAGAPGKPQRAAPGPHDVATICYTSGTSGRPKGAIITHENFLANIVPCVENTDPDYIVVLKDGDIYISYLPLAHVLERICFTIALASGSRIGFTCGLKERLVDDFRLIRPTFFVSVPHVLHSIYNKIRETVEKKNIFVRCLFKLCVAYKTFRQRHGVFRSWLIDRVVFRGLREKFGGNLECSLCGSAVLNPDALEYLQAVLSINIFQGYGQTEALAANILAPLSCTDPKTVGIPYPSLRVKLGPVEGYGDGCGEILMKGRCVIQGYYKNEEKTRELFDSDGWLRTGDIARVQDGKFYIVGRVKEIFKTTYGEYISPEPLESMFQGGPIEDIFITTHRGSSELAGLVVSSLGEDAVRKAIEERGRRLVEERRIQKYEIPKRIKVLRDPFTTYENGRLITPSLKKKRHLMERYFEKEVQSLYEKN